MSIAGVNNNAAYAYGMQASSAPAPMGPGQALDGPADIVGPDGTGEVSDASNFTPCDGLDFAPPEPDPGIDFTPQTFAPSPFDESSKPRLTLQQLKNTLSMALDCTPAGQFIKAVAHQIQEIHGEAMAGLKMVGQDIKQRLEGPLPDGAIRLKGTHGDDRIAIDQLQDGSLNVSVNGKVRSFTPEQAQRLVIEGGAGDDTITASENVTVPLYILGGRGHDTIVGGWGDDYIRGGKGNDTISVRGGNNELFGDEGHDKISGGDGRDYIDGGKGNDILEGGAGNDVIYAGPGNDVVDGGAGNDFINAGSGNDAVEGGEGRDVIFGGSGDDQLSGGSGDDVIIGGLGHDSVVGGSGNDKIRVGEGGYVVPDAADTDVKTLNPEQVPSSIRIDPFATERFREHMRDDLEAMAAIEPGQAMFQGLEQAGKHTMITGTNDANGYAMSFTGNGNFQSKITPLGYRTMQGSGTGSLVSINPLFTNMYGGSESWSETNSMIILAHELSHVYNSATGTMDTILYDDVTGGYASFPEDESTAVSGAEFQAVRLHPGRTVMDNPYGMAENDYREYVGMEQRTSYLQQPLA
ncbi:MAG: M91 family zinc metallopeptidase [bacterium]|nr:M91 family zinc metallopeptidase [bacterium]